MSRRRIQVFDTTLQDGEQSPGIALSPHERTYQIMDPSDVGVHMTLPLGKHSGRHAFARACAERGVTLAGEKLEGAFRRFKERADAGGDLTLEELFQEVTA